MKIIGGLAALALLITVVSLSGRDSARATAYSPTYTVSLTSGAVSANANITITHELDSPQARPATHLSFIPSAFTVANGTAVPTGALVGQLAITASESLSNGPCQSSSLLTYELVDATTNTADTISDTPRIPSASWPGFADTTPANGLRDAVDHYPTFLNTLYPGLTPRSRAFGYLTSSEATIYRAANVLVFEPGTTLPGISPLSASLGYIVAIVLQDPTAPAATSTISDTCTLYRVIRQEQGLTGNNPDTAANEGGVVYRTNPAANGTHVFLDYSRSSRDFDFDGFENAIDSCPTVSTPTWNPRASDPIYDVDGDGLAGQDDLGQANEQLLAGSGCDPTPLTASSDHDGDGYSNRQDNCPLIANGIAQDNQADPDLDGIGNACDVLDNLADGHIHENCVTQNVVIGSGGSPATPACPDLVTDDDNDGYSNADEVLITTNSEDPCGTTAWPPDITSVGPPDTTNKVNLPDLQSFILPVRRLGTSPGDGNFSVRWDLVPGPGIFPKYINVADLQSMTFTIFAMLGNVRAFNGPTCPYP